MEVCSLCLIRGSINKSFQTKENSSIHEDNFKVFIDNEPQERIIIVTSTYITDISTNLALLTFEDVTDLRKSQQIIAKKNEELSNMNIELLAQTEELTQISDLLVETNNKLKESEKFFHTIFDNAYDGILLGDVETKKFVIGNNMICNMLGYNTSEIVNLSVLDIHPEADLPAIIESFEKQTRKEIQVIENIPLKRKNGSIFFADINSTPVTINDKNYLLGIFRDITERKQITEALAEFNQFTTQIIQSAQEGIIVYDHNLNYKVWNPFMERITGLSASMVVGKNPLDFFPFLREAGLIDNYKRVLAGEIITAEDFGYHKPNTGVKGWASETSAPLRNIKGEIIGIIATVNDITVRKENEKLLKEQNEEIETQIEEYQELNENLRSLNGELIVAKQQAEESQNNLKERIKELNGLYSLNLLTEKFDNIDDVFNEFVQVTVPQSMQFTDKTFVFLEIENKKYCNFENCTLNNNTNYLKAPINIQKKQVGELFITYTEELPFIDFYEQKLITEYAERISEIIERIKVQQELVSAKEQAEESESKYKELFDKNSDSITIFRINPDGMPSNILEMNHSVSQLTGFTKEEIQNMTANDFEVNPTIENIQKRIADLQAKGFTHFETMIWHKNGHHIPVEIKVVVINYKNQPALMNVLRDITERKNAEQELKSSRKNLEEAQQIGNYGHWEYNIKNDNLFWSDQVYRIYEIEKETFNLSFKNVVEKFHQDDRQKVIEEYNISLKNRTEFEITNRIISSSGKIKYIIQRRKTQYDNNGNPTNSLGTVQDITTLKEKEFELNELYATKDKFMSILAHDLKNPFNSLIGFSQLIIKNIEKNNVEKINKFANLIYDTSRNTYKLLENLLEWSRSQQDKIPFNPSKIIIHYFVTDCLILLSNQATTKKIEIIQDISPEMSVWADPEMLKTILRNLITNAIKYTPLSGKIILSAKQNLTKVEFKVRDNGIGMDNDTKNSLFKMGQTKSQAGTEGERGTGFGLMLCKEFVEKHGEKIWVESELGKGSDFVFTMPLCKD